MTTPISPEDLDEVRAHNPDHMNGDTIDQLVARVEGVERGLDELRWLMDNSHVTGLRSDGGEMSWSEVRKLYLPDLSRVLEGTE